MKVLLLALLSAPFLASASLGNHPDNPEPGKCYQKVVQPAQYRSVSEKVLVKPEGFKVKTIPAKFAMADDSVVVQEAVEKSIVVPATYKWIKEKVKVEDEKRILNPIPARYKTVAKKIQTKPEGYAWVKGSGPVQKVDSSTGEIMCYKKVPAQYKTVQERVLVSEASVDEKIIPARYSFVKKKVLDQPERIVKKQIPEVRRTIKVRKMIDEPKEIQVKVPAVYNTVMRKELVSPAVSKWSSILCRTNASRGKIAEVQKELKSAGFYKGPLDGIIGSGTNAAVLSFQRSKGLMTGGLTEETMSKLGVSL